jgi:hypothetical protein
MTGRIEKTALSVVAVRVLRQPAAKLSISTEKNSPPCPLPAGEGQADTPKNRHDRGEVTV